MKIQSGSFNYNNKNSSWNLDKGEGTRVFKDEIKFKEKWDSPPTVVVNLSGFDIANNQNARIHLYTEDITDEDFATCILTYHLTQVYGVTGTWIAYGE